MDYSHILKHWKVHLSSSNGTIRITTNAQTKEQAIKQVCDHENAPISAVKKCVPYLPTLTIYDIRDRSQEIAPYFFDRKTLRFWGQLMSSFKVYKDYETYRYYIVAPMKDERKKVVGYTRRWYNPLNNKLESENP